MDELKDSWTIKEKMEWLSEKWRGMVAVTWYPPTSTGGGMFFVTVSYGAEMKLVVDSFASSPEEALDRAMSRYIARSEKLPFVR